MGTRSYLGLIVVAALLSLAAPAGAQETISGPWASRWFVELESAPTADGTSEGTLTVERDRFRERAERAGVEFRERYAYRTLFNGLSISATDGAVAELEQLDGVAAVHPVQTATLDQATHEPSLAFAAAMTGADIARSRLGYSGRGVHVAIMDTGVDYHHPALGGCFGRGCRVSTGYDFVGDDYDEESLNATWQPVPRPDGDPDDCNGHGTHVAGIVGADGAVTGIAPEVTFGAYKVFGCTGGTSADVMLAAMERIYRDGADVLNMSITETLNSWPGSPTAKAATRLVQKGVVVVAGAGNDRFQGLWAGGAPGVGEEVISVASVENAKAQVPAISISPDGTAMRYWAGTGSPPVPGAGSEPLARTGTIASAADACEPLEPGSLTGKVALIRRGTCTFVTKGQHAAAAGATAVVIYNNAGGLDLGIDTTGVPVPAIYIGQQDGELINARLDEGPVTLTWGAFVELPNAAGGLLSGFSSSGLAADLSVKPDIAAPGGLIRSTWPVERGGQAVLSGTSMASPHVAGAAALYLQAHPRAKARDVRAVLQNSADPLLWASLPGLGRLDHVARQGAGLLDIDDAILATTAVTPGKLALGGDEDRIDGATLTLANDGPRTVTYALSNVDALAIAGPSAAAERPQLAAATVTFAHDGREVSAVTVRPGRRARVDVRITADPALEQGAIYGGYLVFTPDAGDQPLRVPYAGFKGDYRAVRALAPTSHGFPWLARQTGIALSGARVLATYERVSDGARFALAPRTFSAGAHSRKGTDAPVVLLHLDHPARRVRVDVHRARTHRRLGRLLAREYLPRNQYESTLSTPHGLITPLALDGRRALGLRDGDYYAVVTVESAGRRTETWKSPVFTIDRG